MLRRTPDQRYPGKRHKSLICDLTHALRPLVSTQRAIAAALVTRKPTRVVPQGLGHWVNVVVVVVRPGPRHSLRAC
jgi:hypothetical protein